MWDILWNNDMDSYLRAKGMAGGRAGIFLNKKELKRQNHQMPNSRLEPRWEEIVKTAK